jgi:quinol monooxygenase YgiN
MTVIERDVFQAKYGRGDDLVKLFKGARALMAEHGRSEYRILTDLSGAFFTVVVEFEWESLAQMEAERQATFSDPGFQEWFAKMPELIESGTRELFTVES